MSEVLMLIAAVFLILIWLRLGAIRTLIQQTAYAPQGATMMLTGNRLAMMTELLEQIMHDVKDIQQRAHGHFETDEERANPSQP